MQHLVHLSDAVTIKTTLLMHSFRQVSSILRKHIRHVHVRYTYIHTSWKTAILSMIFFIITVSPLLDVQI